MARVLTVHTEAARLREAAQIIADDAKRRAGAWSERIPRSFVITVTGITAQITAGGPAAPMAFTFEAPDTDAVWHPVFGDGPRKTWHWVRQEPRRFLLPAAEAMADAAAAKYAEVTDDWAHAAGFV